MQLNEQPSGNHLEILQEMDGARVDLSGMFPSGHPTQYLRICLTSLFVLWGRDPYEIQPLSQADPFIDIRVLSIRTHGSL